MGMKLFSDGDWSSPNPDPTDFSIKKIKQMGHYVIVLLNYPQCTTYGGDKLIVFKTDVDTIKKAKSIDPHFREGNNPLYPVGRYVPDEQGWRTAEYTCNLLEGTLDRYGH